MWLGRRFLYGIDQDAVSFTFRLDIGGIGHIGAVDGAGEKRLQPFGVGADGKPGDLTVRIDAVFAQRIAEQKIAQRTDARSRHPFAAQVFRAPNLRSTSNLLLADAMVWATLTKSAPLSPPT